MERMNKAAAAGVIFFTVILAGFVGNKVDQTTIALLGGAFIGLIVAIPTTALIVLLGLRRRDEDGQVRLGRSAMPGHLPGHLPGHAPLPASPPQYWVMPQPPQATQATQPYPQQAYSQQAYQPLQRPLAAPDDLLPASRRRFYLIGEAGAIHEIEAPQDSEVDQPQAW